MSLIKHRPGALLAVGTLLVIGCIGIGLRTVWPGRGGVPTGDRVWQLSFEFDFFSGPKGSIARIALPVDTAHARVFGQNFYYPGFRQEKSREQKDESREAVFMTSHTGEIHLRAEFQIHCSSIAQWRREQKAAALSPADRDRYLAGETHIQIDDTQVLSIVRQLSSRVTDKTKLPEVIAEYCEKKIVQNALGVPEDAAGVLAGNKATTLGRVRAMVALCRAEKIPARLVSGFVLAEKPDARPHYWAELFIAKKWVPFDPENGHRYELPWYFIPVRLGVSEIIEIKRGSNLSQRYEINEVSVPRGLLGGGKKRLIEIVDLTRLPLSTQHSLITLLMLPVGALVTTFFRNIIGVRTFGTFTPILLALAAVYADWRTATIIFLIVVVIGIGGRALLPGFKLMKVPRLSMVFTLVAFTMTLTVSALDYLNFNPAGHIVLLPMVVLTSIVDRFYSVADDNRMRIALLRLGWTIVVALSCVLFFQWQYLGRSLLVYPELHFITLALLLLLGLYNQKKLTDLPFLRFLTEGPNTKKTEKAVSAE